MYLYTVGLFFIPLNLCSLILSEIQLCRRVAVQIHSRTRSVYFHLEAICSCPEIYSACHKEVQCCEPTLRILLTYPEKSWCSRVVCQSLAFLFTLPLISWATDGLHSSLSSFISRLLKLLPKMFQPLTWHWICFSHWSYSRPDLPFHWMGKLPRLSAGSSQEEHSAQKVWFNWSRYAHIMYQKPPQDLPHSWIFHVVDAWVISHSSLALR